MADERKATVAIAPIHNGDGYSWGGDVIVTIGERAINLGSTSFNNGAELFARELARRWNCYNEEKQ